MARRYWKSLLLFLICTTFAVGSLPPAADAASKSKKPKVTSSSGKVGKEVKAKQSPKRFSAVASRSTKKRQVAKRSGRSRNVTVVSRRQTPVAVVPRFNTREVSSPAELEPVRLANMDKGAVLSSVPKFSTRINGKLAGVTPGGEVVYFTPDPALQSFVSDLTAQAQASHVAIVAMEPRTGRILAMADKSLTIDHLVLHAGFPAASLFKVVTTTAALERGGVQPQSMIRFRGGTYTLNQLNYRTDNLRDTRVMSVAEGLGRSCNPVFARLALNHLNPSILRHYARVFGFNSPLEFDIPLSQSSAFIPTDDFELSRAAAGFGDVFISPVHAAVLMSQIATSGVRPRPSLIDKVINAQGALSYKAIPFGKRVLRSDTAETLLEMMESTTTIGTSRSEFMRRNQPVLPNIRVSAKTGTLTGTNPPGLNHWFIAAAPIEDPQIAIAIIVVDSRGANSKASRLGRRIIERYFTDRPQGRVS